MEDFLRNVPVAEGVIPEGTDDFVDAAFFVCESMNDSLFDLLDEAGFIDDNSQVVEEGIADVVESGKDIFDNVINFFKEIWAKIKAFFEQVIQWFKDQVHEAKSKVATFMVGSKGSTETFNKCPADQKIGTFPEYDFTQAKTVYNGFSDTASAFSTKVSDFSDPDSFAVLNDAIKDSMSGNLNIDLDNIKDEAKRLIVKGDEKEKTKGNIDEGTFKEMVSVITEFTDKKEIQDAYTINKKFINDCVKFIKSCKEKVPFGTSADQGTEIRNGNKVIAKYAAVIKGLASKLTQFNSAVMKLIAERYKNYKKAVYAIAAGAKRGSKKAANESMSFKSLLAM